MEMTRGFSASKRFRHHIGRSSDCSSKRWWWGGQKCSESSKIGTVSESLTAQPEEIWTDGDDGRIQRIKKVLKYPGPILQSSDCK
jgi:hypothetical protein